MNILSRLLNHKISSFFECFLFHIKVRMKDFVTAMHVNADLLLKVN